MDTFKVIIVEDVKLELKGTEQIFRTEIPEAEVIGTAQNESEVWKLFRVLNCYIYRFQKPCENGTHDVTNQGSYFITAVGETPGSAGRGRF